MINIRTGCFETNSSSCHSICISKTPIKNCDNRTIDFRFGDFGWSEETCNNTYYLVHNYYHSLYK